ncbi:hypothetical protein COT30_01700 [Candidatus Micrarchaeota archaeon CG08_land_8_20_14_0_20_49_17]|nr:MAG: hypothetical protein AUJ13_05475 [Candidatus Micrarchaeota archaeon CG1_02_49_24]PIU09970.1 MAG: hypothetical protein COT30_01700 [Candidatus Micrarchaeota archaeon CG08_land_8_20_14_0_20_49_17]PIU81428.1 MAG: hypothetical protein COS70_04160 [Candidatus Micrarchaeota archaeon CG06_land_8_20_14_3_00_50_6]PIZ96226.1 MAG: hypothetical protein COX84_03985 [Candidatus Micrarchaeota archaeon CG_4_10_14_0_2_um_filter_49_7]HII54405.1 hypothetical protein [Candidatus Micrarchaeota archaeon]
MATPKKKSAPKKIKKWYTLYAPQLFSGNEIGELLAAEPETLLNRVVRMSLADLLGKMDPSTIYTFVKMRIKELKGTACHCVMIGHEISPVYMSTLIRRRRSILDVVRDVETTDGIKLRLKALIISVNKLSNNQKTALRNALSTLLAEAASKETFDKFIQEILFGKLSARLFNELKKIAPIRRVEVRKSQIAEVFKKK